MDTMKNTRKKGNSWVWWLVGLGGVGLVVFLSSWKNKELPGQNNQNSGGTTPVPANDPCITDSYCLLGYWKWKILTTKSWFTTVMNKANTSRRSLVIELSYEATAASTSRQPGSDIATWWAMVQSKMASYAGQAEETQKMLAIDWLISDFIRKTRNWVETNPVSKPNPTINLDGFSSSNIR